MTGQSKEVALLNPYITDNTPLLTSKELKELTRALSPNTRAEIIYRCLQYKIIKQNKSLYFWQSNKTYKEDTDEDKLYTIIKALINVSFKKLSSEDRNDVTEVKNYREIFENAHMGKYMKQLLTLLIEEISNLICIQKKYTLIMDIII
jgi:hypothetical protein